MKNTLKIAKAELLHLFYSPVAWLVILVYFVVCGHGFTEPMNIYYKVQKVFLEADATWEGFNGNGLTFELTLPVLQQLVNHLYLFIPLLTMGVINREVNTGTIKLLYSSPIRVREIVLGKYLGLLTLVVMLILIICLFMVSATWIVMNPEIKRHFSSVLGVFLVANAYIAIGLFISGITNYQIVAGVLTFVVFFILNSISGLWQQYDLFRDLTWFLSIAGRAGYLINGLISTRDVCYFILITLLFLGLAMIRLKSTQESKPWTVAFSRYLGLFIIIVGLGYFSGRPGQVKYWDLTRRQTNTIAAGTQQVLQQLDGSPLTVTLYTNLLGVNAVSGLPQNRNYYLWQFWEQYRRFYPNMQFRYVYYYDHYDEDSLLYKMHPGKSLDQIAEKFAKELGIRPSIFLTPEAIRKQIDLHEEGTRLVMQLEYKGKKTWLRTFRDNAVWPGQDCVAGAISRLTTDRVPKFLFVSGHYERNPYKGNDRDYGGHVLNTTNRTGLVNLGIDADTISLRTANIPAATAALVVADPRAEIPIDEQKKIQSWLQQGGNALILGEVKKQQLINPLVQLTGVHINNGTIVHPNAHEMPHLLKASLTHAGGCLAQENMMYEYQRKAIKALDATIEGGANLSYTVNNGFTIQPVIELKGDEGTWIENGVLVVDSAAPTFSVADGDLRQDRYTLGVTLTRAVANKQQRIIITGDADLLTAQRNGVLGNAFYSWLLYNKYPFYANYAGPADKFFTVGPVPIKLLHAGYTYVIPAILVVSAIFLLVRRKRK